MKNDLTQFNNLKLNLEILAEEAGEVMEEASATLQMHDLIQTLSRVIRIKSKIMRFGLTDFHPKNKVPNNESLETEIGHFWAMVEILISQGILRKEFIEIGKQAKYKNLPAYYTGVKHEINK